MEEEIIKKHKSLVCILGESFSRIYKIADMTECSLNCTNAMITVSNNSLFCFSVWSCNNLFCYKLHVSSLACTNVGVSGLQIKSCTHFTIINTGPTNGDPTVVSFHVVPGRPLH